MLTDLQKSALEESLAGFLPQHRWFGAKSRTIRSVAVAELLPIFNTEAWLTILVVEYTEGEAERYLLPILATENPPPDATAITKIDGLALIDATAVPAVRSALLAMTEAEVDDATQAASRVSSAEQSNTSIIFGDQLMLKLFRKLQTGENPDVEICRFLTNIAGFTHIPAFRGSLSAEDGTTLAFAQDFVPNQGDGWEWLSKSLAELFTSKTGVGNSSTVSSSTSREPTNVFADHKTVVAAGLLGRRTAELHLALATPTDDSAFCAEAISRADLAADAARLQAQAESTFTTLKASLQRLPSELTTQAAALLARRSRITEQSQLLATASPFRAGLRIRIHGDYHLGQVLRTEDDFLLVDFEGEPAKPLEQRRRKQSPLRDVAGMLRSFSYAAATAAQNSPGAETSAWEAAAGGAFLASYNATIAALPELAPQTEQTALLLRAYLLEKSLYELLYELNNRPDWVRIPLAGILSLLEKPA